MSGLYLFDTNILVHLVRNDVTGQYVSSKYKPFMRALKPFICTVSEGELHSLALQWAWGKHKLDQMQFLLGYFRHASIERPDVMQAYATLDACSHAQGNKMGKNDLWIAATAYISGAQIVTTDTDFDHLDTRFVFVDRVPLTGAAPQPITPNNQESP